MSAGTSQAGTGPEREMICSSVADVITPMPSAQLGSRQDHKLLCASAKQGPRANGIF